jgi:DNA-binding XRE family transcriptional regulator
LGTQAEVAKSFDVSRATVAKWQRELGANIEYHPEIPRAKAIKEHLRKRIDRVRIAQWICDEGWISAIYDLKTNDTFLIVGGQMTDIAVLKVIAGILHESVTRGTGTPHYGWLPLSAVKVRSAEAYALLKAIRKELIGLKRLEAEAALKFFPASGFLKGRHPTDEFMEPIWRTYAKGVLSEWNKRSEVPVTAVEEEAILQSWMERRIKKGRWSKTPLAKRKPNLDALNGRRY